MTITQSGTAIVGNAYGRPAPALTGNNGGISGTVNGNTAMLFIAISEVIGGNISEAAGGNGNGTASRNSISGTFLGDVVVITVDGYAVPGINPLCVAADHRFSLTR